MCCIAVLDVTHCHCQSIFSENGTGGFLSYLVFWGTYSKSNEAILVCSYFLVSFAYLHGFV